MVVSLVLFVIGEDVDTPVSLLLLSVNPCLNFIFSFLSLEAVFRAMMNKIQLRLRHLFQLSFLIVGVLLLFFQLQTVVNAM